MKVCNGCKAEKPNECFSRRNDRPNGLQSKCKNCKRDEQREFHMKNPNYQMARYASNPKSHREAGSVRTANRRARLLAAQGEGITSEEWDKLKEDYGYRCAYCAKIKTLAKDHIEALSKGGEHRLSNIVPACKSCNSSKHSKALIVWLATAGGF